MALDAGQVTEIIFLFLSVLIFGGYHYWLFGMKHSKSKDSHFNMWYAGRYARLIWAQDITSNGRDALQTLGVQNLRNAITASSFLATGCSVIAVNGLLPILVDSTKIAQLNKYALTDPILENRSAVSAEWKISVCVVAALFSFLCFAQSIRLMVHMGFFLKVVPSEFNHDHMFKEEELFAMCMRSSLCFTIGLRAFYAVIPLVLWLMGPTAMLVITILVVASLFYTDILPSISASEVHKFRRTTLYSPPNTIVDAACVLPAAAVLPV